MRTLSRKTGDASRRLPAPDSGDEVGQLTITLNGMLKALERAHLATALGSAVADARDGRNHVVAGLVPPLVAENAARGLLARGVRAGRRGR